MDNVGARIKAFRESHGLTQKDIFQATKGEIKQTSLSAIENNQAKPGFDTLSALLDAYPTLSSDWLLRGTGPMLKDGQLPPVVPSEARPYKEHLPKKPGEATPSEIDFVGSLIRQFEEQVARYEEREAQWTEREAFYQELLRKKPEGNLIAAGLLSAPLLPPATPISLAPAPTKAARELEHEAAECKVIAFPVHKQQVQKAA
ncbi:MAG: helix-turn-helix protein [Hymenobacter sp.]|nr:helix-turn-helix protein [Hymenobacter sp.]